MISLDDRIDTLKWRVIEQFVDGAKECFNQVVQDVKANKPSPIKFNPKLGKNACYFHPSDYLYHYTLIPFNELVGENEDHLIIFRFAHSYEHQRFCFDANFKSKIVFAVKGESEARHSFYTIADIEYPEHALINLGIAFWEEYGFYFEAVLCADILVKSTKTDYKKRREVLRNYEIYIFSDPDEKCVHNRLNKLKEDASKAFSEEPISPEQPPAYPVEIIPPYVYSAEIIPPYVYSIDHINDEGIQYDWDNIRVNTYPLGKESY